MYTSTMFGSPSKSKSQTPARMSAFDSTSPRRRMRSSSTANAVERDSEDGATWEVEVTRADGSTVDVRLDEHLALVVVEGDSETPDSDDAD